MATPHLVSHDQHGQLITDRNLTAHAGRLAVIRKTTTWSDKTMVVTPSYESYTSVASFCKYAVEGEKNYVRDNQIAEQLRTVFAAKTDADWISGHKPCFMYWSRGDMTLPTPNTSGGISSWTFDPWFAKTTTKTGSEAESEGALVNGCGASWSALYFNLYAFPLNKCYSLSMKLRLFNPSMLAYDWWQLYAQPFKEHREVNVPTAATAGSGSLNMKYNFSASLGAPSSFDTQADPAETIDFSSGGGIVNQGKMSGYDLDSEANISFYDPWDITGEHASSDLGAVETYAKWPTLHYRPANNGEYYADVTIPSAMVEKLKGLQLQGYGGFWLTIGPSGNGIYTSSFNHGYSAMMYFSRVELVISTGYVYAFNN